MCVYIHRSKGGGVSNYNRKMYNGGLSSRLFSSFYCFFTLSVVFSHTLQLCSRISPAYTCIHKCTLYVVKSYPHTLLYLLIELKIFQIKYKSTCKICILFFDRRGGEAAVVHVVSSFTKQKENGDYSCGLNALYVALNDVLHAQ